VLLAVSRPQGLVDAIHALPVGAGSPFAGLRGTHTGRFTVIDLHSRRDRSDPLLALSAAIDGEAEPWLAAFVERLGPERAEAILGRCAGWPGRDGAVAWLVDHLVEPTLPFATWEAPVTTIVDALERTDAIRAFALETQTMTAAARHACFVERFGSVER
jgi:hypothetical protein